jgi:cell fate regulator YaaT (PSP1 superfamily)
MTDNIVGVRFQKFGKIYHFSAEASQDIQKGDFAVVDTSRGQQLGEVIQILDSESVPREGYLKPILRVATPRDLVLRQVWQYKENEAVEICRSKLKEIKITGVKIIAAEFTFDGKRLTFLYNSEGDESVDLSKLRDELKGLFQHIRIDMRQIGPRDVAKIVGGMGACGIGNRCCSMFLTEFSPISIRMAKTQGVSLAPTEITGMCGRLRCCMGYEYEHYVEARKELPKEKTRITTPAGDGKVVSVSPLVKTILVDLGEGGLKEFSLEELQEPPKPPQPVADSLVSESKLDQSPQSKPRRRVSSRRKRKRRK